MKKKKIHTKSKSLNYRYEVVEIIRKSKKPLTIKEITDKVSVNAEKEQLVVRGDSVRNAITKLAREGLIAKSDRSTYCSLDIQRNYENTDIYNYNATYLVEKIINGSKEPISIAEIRHRVSEKIDYHYSTITSALINLVRDEKVVKLRKGLYCNKKIADSFREEEKPVYTEIYIDILNSSDGIMTCEEVKKEFARRTGIKNADVSSRLSMISRERRIGKVATNAYCSLEYMKNFKNNVNILNIKNV